MDVSAIRRVEAEPKPKVADRPRADPPKEREKVEEQAREAPEPAERKLIAEA